MVDRFLSWKLPQDFRPDAGISFKATFNEHTPWPMKHEPTGTNLLDAIQAEAMVRHMLDGLPTPARWRSCPRCRYYGKTVRLRAVISADGSAWEADHCDACGGNWFNDPPLSPADIPAPTAPAQPDARDAEIARLKEELEAATATIEDEQAAHEETRADAARLTKELEEARAGRDSARKECEKLAARAGELHRDATNAASEAKDLREALRNAANALKTAGDALAAKWQHPGICSGPDAEHISKTGFWAGIGEVMAQTKMAHHRALRALTPQAPPAQPSAPREPKAETPAETAGQKEGRE